LYISLVFFLSKISLLFTIDSIISRYSLIKFYSSVLLVLLDFYVAAFIIYLNAVLLVISLWIIFPDESYYGISFLFPLASITVYISFKLELISLRSILIGGISISFDSGIFYKRFI